MQHIKRKVDYHIRIFFVRSKPILELKRRCFDVNENLLLKELIHQELISFIELTIKDLLKSKKRTYFKKICSM